MTDEAADNIIKSEELLTYFRYPERYFWRWSEEGVAEWQNGTTIAYAQELIPLLAELAPDGLPPLGAALLVLAACSENWKDSSAEMGPLQGLVKGLPPAEGQPATDELLYLVRVASGFLDIIRALPTELRTGRAKLHLLRELLPGQGFEGKGQHLPETSLTMPAKQLKQLMAEIGSDPPTLELLTLPTEPVTRQEVQADLLYFDRALSRFTVHSLELRLRTSLTALPEPLALDLPTPPADAEPTPTDLLAELAQDAPTAGLARLAQRLAALLHLPQHAEGAGSLPLGGVADVANRGTFDRLLLSELAQDDLSLTARLVHGEALYLRREEPPAPQPPPRVVLVDTTIQLWGEPRVFALAAALAVAHPARARQQPRVAAYALGGTQPQSLDLFTKAGVTEALGYLDPALHCGPALNTLLRTPSTAPTDYLLITEAEAATHPDFSRHLAEAAPALRFLLTVARGGELAFYEFRQGRRTLLSTLHVDLEELLFAKLPGSRRRLPVPAPSQLVPPAFLKTDPCPLALPTVDFQPTADSYHYQAYIYDAKFGLVGLTTTRRLLHWPRRDQGARELMHVLEEGKTCLGFDGAGTVYLLFVGGTRNESVRLYIIPHPAVVAPTLHDFSTELGQLPGIRNLTADLVVKDAFFGDKDSFYLHTPAGFLALLCKGATPRLVSLAFTPATAARFRATPGQLKKFVNNGYNVLQRISRVGVNALGELTVGNHSLIKTPPNVLKLQANKLAASPSERTAYFAEDIYALHPNRLIRFQYAAWPDGSVAITDSRGLLHLRSADTHLPEITLTLVLGKSIAAWADAGPDGTVCGSPYYVQGSLARLVSVPKFYQLYIQPFIDHIVAHEATPASA
jgi:hypothetical protein